MTFFVLSYNELMKFLKPQFHSKSLRIGIIILVILSFFLLTPSSLSKEIKNLFYSVSLPTQKWLWEKGAGLSGFFDMVSHYNEILFGPDLVFGQVFSFLFSKFVLPSGHGITLRSRSIPSNTHNASKCIQYHRG